MRKIPVNPPVQLPPSIPHHPHHAQSRQPLDDVAVAEVFVLAGSVSSDLADPAGGRVGDLPGSFPAEEGLGGPLGFLVHTVWAAGLEGRGAVDDVGGMEVKAGGARQAEVGCLEGDEAAEVGGKVAEGVVELEFEGENCGDGGMGGDGGGLMGWQKGVHGNN